MSNPFGEYDERFEQHGFVCIPVQRGGKKPAVKNWTKAAELTQSERANWRQEFASANIGLLAGTQLSTGRLFGFIDVDEDRLVEFVKRVLGETTSSKRGQKGLTVFCQIENGTRNAKLKLQGASAPAVEIFATKGMTVVPTSDHPSGRAYQWLGPPLLEIEHAILPILTKELAATIAAVVRSPHAKAIIDGGADVKAHDVMRSLTSSGIANLTDDLEWLSECLNALFHPDYAGDTKSETLGMLRSAKDKGLGKTPPHADAYDPGDEGPIPLGYSKQGDYVFRDPTRDILMSASAQQLLSTQYLLGLAPTEFWQAQFPSGGKSRQLFSAYAAGEALIAECKRCGPFISNRVRGRGIWPEDERIIVNLGGEVESSGKFLYLCFEPLQIENSPNFDTARLLAFLKCLPWRDALDAFFALGWMALGPICGVLSWRPHLFVYGPPNSGKTTLHRLVTNLLHPLIVSADGQSTEAGLRQTLGPDSLPIAIDEFETDQRQNRLKSIINLARSASSADTPVLRGTPEGKALQFSLRTMFFFSAINVTGMTPADETRIIMAELTQHSNDPEMGRFITTEAAHFSTLGPKWAGYMASLAGHISGAIETLTSAWPNIDSRHRQNMATLLAGAFVALHGRAPTSEEAREFAGRFTSAVERHGIAHERDDAAEALYHLLQYPIRASDGEMPLGHWLGLELDRLKRGVRSNHAAESAHIVAGHDIKFELQGDNLGWLIRNGSPAINRIFAGTRWADGAWRRALEQLPGTFKPGPVYFPSVRDKARATGLPLDRIPKPVDRPDDDDTPF